MVYLKKKRWLLLLKQLDFQPLRGDLAQVVRLLNKMPLQGKLLKPH